MKANVWIQIVYLTDITSIKLRLILQSYYAMKETFQLGLKCAAKKQLKL